MSSKSYDYAINGILTTGKTLYLNEKFSDFSFICKSADGLDEIIPVHKSFLASVSDVFDVMFSDTWKGKVNVVIPDATAAEFREFLQFFYLERAKLTTDNIERVMYLGNKYIVPECMNACVKFLHRILTEDNICFGYSLAILYNQNELKRFCELIIASKTRAVFSSASFLECSKDALEHILKMDSLSCSEVDVFEACMEWVKSACGLELEELTREIIQTYLGDLIYKIRFKSIKPQQFGYLASIYGRLFSSDEYREIVQLTALSHFEPNAFKQTLRTSFKKFQFNESEKIVCDRLMALNFSTSPYYIKHIEKTVFSVNQPMVLQQIVCSQVCEYKSNDYFPIDGLSTEIKIVQVSESESSDEEIILHDKKFHLKSELTYINFSKTKLVRPGFMYEIQLKQTPPPNYCTGNILKTEVQLESNILIQFYRDPIGERDKVARGIVHKIAFYRV
ncbi:BTB/POZ domain-containing protein 3-like [Contarinia nasturtii]|uniref:BTB/POZ domain-containing protein 3-like n=1 Tax=Contarinia nasturtii TaxID=265458 RepID=UPI0012D4B9DC|nr:BTB/POZ domain-containing protein 3-like [Contarinia nasturtii]